MMLQTSTATVLGTTRWPTLKTVREAATAIGIEEQRLLDLADAQLAPHWRIDGGPPQFVLSELREWASRELLKKYDGRSIPTNLFIVYEAGETNLRAAPKAIQDLQGLRDATELLQLRSGIYFLCELGHVVYVGQSVNVGGRVGNHRGGKDFDRIFFLPWPRFDLTRIEAALIKVLR
ncbi:MAG: GIY-YIG nuclease family protein, partial [Xanthobacteraceae bacterium]